MSTPVVELPWHIVEKAIATEKEWLLRVFDFGQQRKTIQLKAGQILVSIKRVMQIFMLR